MIDQRLKFPRIVHAFINPSREWQTEAVIGALFNLPKRFTHVLATFPAWQSWPDIDRLMGRLIFAVGKERLILSRWLWPWGKEDRSVVADPMHYALAIQRIKMEADRYGVAACGLDGEAYGSTVAGWMKGPLGGDDNVRVIKAAYDAVKRVGKVDMFFPTGSGRSDWYSWYLRLLGEHNICTRAYYSSAADMPKIKAPGPYFPEYWGTAVGSDDWPSVEDALSIDFPTIRETPMFRNLYGQFVYIPHVKKTTDADGKVHRDYTIYPDTMQRFREASDG